MERFHANNPVCFCCGTENSWSFGLQVRGEGEELHGTASLGFAHEGEKGIAHGGALLALLDEMVGDFATFLGRPSMTANISADFRAPAYLPSILILRASREREEGRKLWVRTVASTNDRLIVEATALLLARVAP